MSEESEDLALIPSRALYGTGVTGMFSDSLVRKYLSFLAVSVGISVTQMSYLRAAEGVSGHMLQLYWGQLVDRKGKRVFIALGRFLNGAILGMLIFVQAPAWVMALIIGSAICGSIVRPAWSSLMGDYTTYFTRGTVIGKINALSQIGSLAAMFIAFILSFNQVGQTTYESFKLILALSSGMSIASGLMSLFIREKPSNRDNMDLDLWTVLRDTRFRRYLLTNLLYGTGLAFAWPLFPFVIVDRLSLKIWHIAAYSFFSAATSMFTQRYVGSLMDKIGRRPIVVFSRMILTLGPIIYIVATNWTHIAAAEILLGLGMGAWMSSGPTYIIDLAPVEMRATYLAVNTAAFGLSSFIGNLLGGYITYNFLITGGILQGINSGLMISAILRFTTGLLFFFIHETFQPHAKAKFKQEYCESAG